ncbi:hypothetical protein [Streptomyces xanthochromogenes]|uniref:Secreted protein n=1 Tax=Streptomyces xanthochromogenes TaxID=67384 RepID=A0ABQ3A6T1_9ACTN|nr:hypothetical protein [Streptomyces xanthochromogenes]GGY38697.1 hypothetical protein GCM10010326_35960 [Streptomyces xanthochromogenes]
MTLQSPQPPDESREAAEAGLQLLAGLGRVRTATLLPAAPDDLRLVDPVQMYTVAPTGALTDARPVSWRYLVRHGDEPVALAETVRDASGAHVFGQLNYGPFVAGTAAALAAAGDAGGERPGDAEVRLLHVPAVHLIAVWLHADSADTLVPAAPAPSGIEAGRPYPAAQLLSLVAEFTPPTLTADDDRGGG